MNPHQTPISRLWRPMAMTLSGVVITFLVLARLHWGGWTPPPSDHLLLEEAGKIRLDMTTTEVFTVLGKPTSASSLQTQGSTVTRWGYHNGRLEVGFVGDGPVARVFTIETRSQLDRRLEVTPRL